jgi:hypothetical protein
MDIVYKVWLRRRSKRQEAKRKKEVWRSSRKHVAHRLKWTQFWEQYGSVELPPF